MYWVTRVEIFENEFKRRESQSLSQHFLINIPEEEKSGSRGKRGKNQNQKQKTGNKNCLKPRTKESP